MIHDERTPPFCWQAHDAIERIRAHFAGRRVQTALAAYLGLTYLASTRYREGGRDGFAASRKEVAGLIGIKTSTFDEIAGGLIEIGLLDKRHRTDDTGRDIAPVWALPGTTSSGGSRGRYPGVPASVPGGPLGEPEGDPPKRARVTEQEKDNYLGTTSVSGRGGAREPADFPEGFPESLRPVARRVAEVLAGIAAHRPGAAAVRLGAVARAMRDYPDRDYLAVAGDLEHWLLYGNGQRAQAKDVARRYRFFLDGAPVLARPAERPSGAQGNVTPLRRREHPADARARELRELQQRLREERESGA